MSVCSSMMRRAAWQGARAAGMISYLVDRGRAVDDVEGYVVRDLTARGCVGSEA